MELQTNTPLPTRFHSDEDLLPKHSYQPPITCSHGRVMKSTVKVRKVRLLECKDCGLTVGVVGPKQPPGEYPPEPTGPVTVFLAPPPSRFALWIADQLDGLERACMPPDGLVRWWRGTF